MNVAVDDEALQVAGFEEDSGLTCGRQVVHYELLSMGQTVVADLYSAQLKHEQQKEPALQNRKDVLFLHD
ncbi:hypothetical protein NPIL_560711 [Nephila pilipes]|uniref:Uncharacterized protein n=1 Tax=Nephila pilipes TaxID=299642 RepID=A0A8X6PUU9_NEPPI|nr:hypothetical protein NPIL_560711 [Nephila pilipes]